MLETPTARLNFIEEATSVGAANFPLYRKNYALFRSCYERLRDLFPQLG